ncbi:MAG: helix-turn-helix transcriptional regulator [Hydrogenoanaerobacterium sp.]
MNEQARIGTRIKTLREEKHMSQADLSVALGVSRMTINNYEQGKRVPDVDFALLTARYFGVTVDYLSGRTEFRDKDDIKVSVGKAEMLIKTMERLPQYKCQVLLDNLDTFLLLAIDSEIPQPIIGIANKAIVELNHFVEGYDELQKSMVCPVSELKRRLVPESQIRLALRDKEKAIGGYAFRANQHIGEAIASCVEDMEKELLHRADEAMGE